MKRLPVSSSVIKSIGYQSNTKILEVEFIDQKTIYQYHAVPLDKFNALMQADSHGKYFNQQIKDQYRFTKIVKD